MRSLTLWRLNGAAPGLALADPEALPTGLRRHLRTAWLVTCLVQIRSRQQAYVGLVGCPGCAHGRCEAGCRVESLRRTLRAAAHPLALSPVRRGLAARPYTRHIVATPTRHARPLPPAVLLPWAEARLTVTLRPGPRGRLLVGAALSVGADGPDPAATLRHLGWRAWRGWRAGAPDFPSAPQLRVWPYPGPPWLLLPTAREPAGAELQGRPDPHGEPADVASAEAQAEASAEAALAAHARAAERLRRILGGEALAAPPQARAADRDGGGVPNGAGAAPDSAAADGWPAGPGQGNGAITPAVLAALFARLLNAAGPDGAQGAESGLTLRRMNLLLGDRHNEHSRAMLLWLAAAGLLAAPADAEQPWAAPRALTATDPDAVMARLRATALPTAAAVEQAKRTIKK